MRPAGQPAALVPARTTGAPASGPHGQPQRRADPLLYHDVAIMAVGQTQRDPARQHELLAGLIGRAASDREHGWRLWLLAAACIADVGMVDPELAERIHQETRRLLPPTSLEEADTVARAGEFVLDLLAETAQHRRLTDRQAAATVRAGALVGGEAAMPLLRSFRLRPGEEVQRELVAAWFRSQLTELRPGGRLVFTVPLPAVLDNLLFSNALGPRYQDQFNEYWHHVTMQSADAWQEMVGECAPELTFARRLPIESRRQTEVIDLLWSVVVTEGPIIQLHPELAGAQRDGLAR
jgi:hypothetical protein